MPFLGLGKRQYGYGCDYDDFGGCGGCGGYVTCADKVQEEEDVCYTVQVCVACGNGDYPSLM